MTDKTTSAMPAKLPIARNTMLLSAAIAALYGMVELSAAVAPITFAAVTGLEGLVGLGPATYSWAQPPSPRSPRAGRWIVSEGFPCSRGVSVLEYWVARLPASGPRWSPWWRWSLGSSSSGLRSAR